MLRYPVVSGREADSIVYRTEDAIKSNYEKYRHTAAVIILVTWEGPLYKYDNTYARFIAVPIFASF